MKHANKMSKVELLPAITIMGIMLMLLQYFFAAVICEGEKGWLQCENDQMLSIARTFWGRDDDVTCPKVPAEQPWLTIGRKCEANLGNAMQKINGQCKDEQACEVVASNIFFDDNSCGDVYKYLKVSYDCIAD